MTENQHLMEEPNWENGRNLEMTCEELCLDTSTFLDWVSSGKNFLDIGCGKGKLLADLEELIGERVYGCDIIKRQDNPRIIKGAFNQIDFRNQKFSRILCLASIFTYALNNLEIYKDLAKLSECSEIGAEVVMFLNPLTDISLFHGGPAAMFSYSYLKNKSSESPLDASYFVIKDFEGNQNLHLPLLDLLKEYGFNLQSKWIAGRDWRIDRWKQKHYSKPHSLGIKLVKYSEFNRTQHYANLAKAQLEDLKSAAISKIFSVLS